MAISAVGSIAISNGVNTLSVSPTAIGNILVLTVPNTGSGVNTPLTAVSGGGVTTWVLVAWGGYRTPGYGIDLWYGVVTSTGASTITITASSPSYGSMALGCLEFSGGSAGTWSLDGGGSSQNGHTSSFSYPSLTPSGANELYVATCVSSSLSTSGQTSGFTYIVPLGLTGNEANGTLVYNVAASSPTAQSPNQSTSLAYWQAAAILLIFTATPPVKSRRPKGLPAAVRRANNYFKRESGLWEPERGLIVPRAA